MGKNETKIMITEQFKSEDINKRKETLDKLLYKIIKTKEIIHDEVKLELGGMLEKEGYKK